MSMSTTAGPGSGRPQLRQRAALGSAVAQLPENHHYKFDCGVFIGRMRPVTRAHLADIYHTLDVAALAIIVIGSAQQAPSPRNPFDEAQVEAMLRGNFTPDQNARIVVVAMRDLYNSALWLAGVRRLVKDAATSCGPRDRKPRIALVGHFKDERTSDYLKRFHPWTIEPVPDFEHISASPIRDHYWEDPERGITEHAHELPENVAEFLRSFATTPDYAWLAEEHRAYVKDRSPYLDLRFKPTFHAADAVVVMDGHVLLIERDQRPGLGLLSLPGVFVRETEEIQAAMMRGLYDKARIKLPKRIAAAHIAATHEFSYPYRSERGRIISTAFLIDLNDEEEFPKVRPGDGARSAQWMPIDDLDPRRFFEDHMRVFEVMLGYMRES